MPAIQTDLATEQATFNAEVESIEAAWKCPRQAHLVRPYSARTIAGLRNSIPQTYASSTMADKLWAQLNEHRKDGTCELTYGATDPIQVSQMAKHQQTVYVSGSLCGVSEVSTPGRDAADYPWDTVPKAVDKIFRSQMWHDQRQRHELENWDYLAPIIADADMGFGGLTSIVKMTKAFVEAGVAMIHMDDLAIGMKRFSMGMGRTAVPTSEYVSRLTAVRMQFDIMGATTMLMCRCDTATYHPYILGATKDVPSLASAISISTTTPEYQSIRKTWKESAGLMTFDEAVKALAAEEQYKTYSSKLSEQEVTPMTERRKIAKQILGQDVLWDWELPRSTKGQYMWKPTIQTVIERASAVAQLGDVTWARIDAPTWPDLVTFHEATNAKFPNRLFGFGYVGGYDFSKAGFSEEQIKNLHKDLAKLGVVWQVQPVWVTMALSDVTDKFGKMWQEEGMGMWVRDCQRTGWMKGVDGAHKMGWSGGYLADGFAEAVSGRDMVL
ncbi:isocitrate lyase [Mollisia scopiformis]|uniref:Isocitrate lyase n=1 Tax=Mollisia scopiformis TaxID=149040 RepID=A0A194XBJ5_MOLSC|nr:isocitrate lyase [Mollisia scopiformis]KUJ17531.1 isocitrate lyase [Mollisia scopiformis]